MMTTRLKIKLFKYVYIPKLSEKYQKISGKYTIKSVIKTNNTLKSILTKDKPSNYTQNLKKCIYKCLFI